MSTIEPEQETGTDLIARAILDSGLAADCSVSVRDCVTGAAETVAYVVPAQNVSAVLLKRRLSSHLEERGCACRLVLVSALPLTPAGESDRVLLAQRPVCDPRSFPAWEGLVRTQWICDSVSIDEIDSVEAIPKVHLSDLAVAPTRTILETTSAQPAGGASGPGENAG